MNVTCTISGNLYPLRYDWSISKKSYQRDSFSGTVSITDLNVDLAFGIGEVIRIDYNSTRIFEGVIKSFSMYDGTGLAQGYKLMDITATDYNTFADRRRISAVVDNMTAADAITNYLMPVLSEEGVTVGEIDADITIIRDVWRYYKISECLDRIKELDPNYVWYIDYDKKLYFKPKDTLPTVNLDKSTVFNFRWNRDMDNYFNTLTVLGQTVRTSQQTLEELSPLADGTTRTFTARFPLAEKPVALWYYTGSGSWIQVDADDIGVNGIDTGKKWWWSYNSNTITQDSGETVLPAGGKVQLSYIGLRPLLIKSENLAAIADRKAAEGGSGIYDGFQEISSLDSFGQASQYVSSLLWKYSDQADNITFDTYNYIDLYSNLYIMFDEFYRAYGKLSIDSIVITQSEKEGDTYIKLSVKAIDSASFGGWETYFYDIVKAQRKFTVDDSTTLQEIRAISEGVSVDGSVTIQGYGGLIIPFTLPATLGGTMIDEVIIND